MLFSLCSVNHRHLVQTFIWQRQNKSPPPIILPILFFPDNELCWITKILLVCFSAKIPNEFAPLQKAFLSWMGYGVWEACHVVQSWIPSRCMPWLVQIDLLLMVSLGRLNKSIDLYYLVDGRIFTFSFSVWQHLNGRVCSDSGDRNLYTSPVAG